MRGNFLRIQRISRESLRESRRIISNFSRVFQSILQNPKESFKFLRILENPFRPKKKHPQKWPEIRLHSQRIFKNLRESPRIRQIIPEHLKNLKESSRISKHPRESLKNLKESSRISKHPQESLKNLKESSKIPENLKESSRISKHPRESQSILKNL